MWAISMKSHLESSLPNVCRRIKSQFIQFMRNILRIVDKFLKNING